VTGGTLNIVGQGDVDSMDTANGYYDTTYTAYRAFVRTLYTYASAPTFSGQVNAVPDLATALPVVTNSGKTYTITIRQGAMWNTTPPRQVTAADEIRGIMRLCNPASPAGAIAYYTATIVGFNDFCNGTSGSGGGFSAVDPTSASAMANYMNSNSVPGMKATSNLTIQFTLTQPSSDFVNILSMYFAAPAPVEYNSYIVGSATQAQHTISDGPYTITNYNPTVSITFGKDPAWQQSTDPVHHQYVNGIQVTEGVATATAAVQQVQAGTQDMLWDQIVPPAQLATMTNDPNLVIGPQGTAYATNNPTLDMNIQSPNNGGALSKLGVRQAIEYAINKTAVSQVYGGAAVSAPLDQVVLPGAQGYVGGFNPYPTSGHNGDAAKAKQMLQAAGYQPGQITLKLIYRTTTVHPQVATTDQAALQAAGFTVQLIPVTPSNTFYTKYLQNPTATKAGSWDLAESGWSPDWYGPTNARSTIVPLFDGRSYGPGSNDYMDYNNSVVNGYIDKALSATSLSASTQNWQLAAQQIMHDAVVVPEGQQKNPVNHSSRLKNAIFWNFSENFDVTQAWLQGG